jgi:ABC-2 type transport system permease protein
MKWNATLLGFIRKEFAQALRDPRMRALLFIGPIVQMTLFGVAISSDVKNVRIAYQPRLNDTVLEHIYERSIASGWFIPAEVKSQSPFDQIQNDEADVVLVAPPEGVTASIARGQGQVQLLVNASNVIRAQSVENSIRSILQEVEKRDLQLDANNSAVKFDTRILYNPTGKTSVFMVPGVMSMLICLITVLLTSMSISREKETGTFEMLISAPVKSWEIILGKTLPYVLLGLCNVPLILGVAVFAFGVPMHGSFFILMLSAFVFVCATVSIGTLISILTKTQQQSMMGGFLFLFPAFQLSGLMFPIENMPLFMKAFAYLNPLTYFLELLRNIMLKGGEVHVIVSHLSVLILMAVILSYVSYKKFNTHLK